LRIFVSSPPVKSWESALKQNVVLPILRSPLPLKSMPCNQCSWRSVVNWTTDWGHRQTRSSSVSTCNRHSVPKCFCFLKLPSTGFCPSFLQGHEAVWAAFRSSSQEEEEMCMSHCSD